MGLARGQPKLKPEVLVSIEVAVPRRSRFALFPLGNRECGTHSRILGTAGPARTVGAVLRFPRHFLTAGKSTHSRKDFVEGKKGLWNFEIT